MKLLDTWAAEPKQPHQNMKKKDRIAKFGDQKWRLTQAHPGGHDTIATNLYPKFHRQNAIVEKSRQGVALKESTTWRESKGSSSWKDSSSWKESTSWKDTASWKDSRSWKSSSEVKQEEPETKETPGSSSTSWNRDSWQGRDWQSNEASQSNYPEAPWKKEENQLKRRKW